MVAAAVVVAAFQHPANYCRLLGKLEGQVLAVVGGVLPGLQGDASSSTVLDAGNIVGKVEG